MAKVKKRKFSIKKTLRLLVVLILIFLLFSNSRRIITFFKSVITGYEYETIETFNELDIYSDVRKHKYSPTLAKIIETDSFKKEYLSNYLDIKYNKNDKNFIDNINALLDIGYDSIDINQIYDKLSLNSIGTLLENDYFKSIFNVLNLDYFHENYLLRYLNYAKKNTYDSEDVVTYVNIGLDNDYYTNTVTIDNPEDMFVLVNKYHLLPSSYEPNDLETINSKYNKGNHDKLRHEARINFEEMCENALKDGIKIYSGSAYRSYNYQKELYNYYVYTEGFDKANTFSARPGASEHQTGLATDILNEKLDYISKDDKEYTWLVENSYKYGYILRYPLNKEKTTGYMYEEWHYRYIGKDIAKELHDTNLTYDEYVARS